MPAPFSAQLGHVSALTRNSDPRTTHRHPVWLAGPIRPRARLVSLKAMEGVAEVVASTASSSTSVVDAVAPAVTATAVAAAAAPENSGPFDFIADALESLLKVGRRARGF